MNTFSIVRDALAKTEGDPNKVGLDAGTVEAGRVLAAVQTVVDALTPPAGGRYVVGFADIATAGTSLADHHITVSGKPLRDPLLTLVEKAVVIATFTAHEIGHTYVTRPRKQPVHLIDAHNPAVGYKAVANMADDIILEPFMVERFPILADAFEFTAMWVLRTTAESLPHRDTLNAGTSAAQRFNIIMHATRYGDIPQIEWNDDNVRAERDWARAWAQRLLDLRLTDHDGFLALCDEVWERVRTVDEEPEPDEQPRPEPEPEDTDEPGQPGGEEFDEESEDEDDDEDDESEDDDPGEDGTEPGDEPTDEQGDGEPDEPTDEDGESEPPPGGDDEPTDEQGDEPGEDGEDGDGEDGDEPGGDTGSGDSESDEDGDGDGDEDGDEPGENPGHGDYDGHDGNSDTPDDASGGGGNAEANKDTATLRDEDDFDESEVDETTHDSAETDYLDEALDRKTRTYDATTATAFGIHGSILTTWE